MGESANRDLKVEDDRTLKYLEICTRLCMRWTVCWLSGMGLEMPFWEMMKILSEMGLQMPSIVTFGGKMEEVSE